MEADMRVKAKPISGRTYSGYYNLVLRKPGDVFDLLDPSHFSETWMERVDENIPKTPAPGEPSKEDLEADGLLPAKGKGKKKVVKVADGDNRF